MEDEAPVLVAWLKGDRSAGGHQRQGDRARDRRSFAQATRTQSLEGQRRPPGFHRRNAIQSTRRGLPARVGKR